MSEFMVTKKRIYAGIWEGVVTADKGSDALPKIEVIHLEKSVQSVSLVADPDIAASWQLRIAIPPELLSDGIQVFMIKDVESGEVLDAFTILTGEAIEDDISAEVEMLRAELDMLKRAFRRHCLEA
jgi:hypothetical protein